MKDHIEIDKELDSSSIEFEVLVEQLISKINLHYDKFENFIKQSLETSEKIQNMLKKDCNIYE